MNLDDVKIDWDAQNEIFTNTQHLWIQRPTSCLISGARADAGKVQEQGVEEGLRRRQAGAHEAGAASGPQGVLQIRQFLSPENLSNSKIFG